MMIQWRPLLPLKKTLRAISIAGKSDGFRAILLVPLSLALWLGIAWLSIEVWLELGSMVSVDQDPPTAMWPFLLLLPIAVWIGWLILWPRKRAEKPKDVSDQQTRVAAKEREAPSESYKEAAALATNDEVRRGIIAGIQQTAERSLLEGPVVKHGRRLLVAAISVGTVIWLGGALWSGIQVQSVQRRAAEATQDISLANENVRVVLHAAQDSVRNRLGLLDVAIAAARDTVAAKRDSALVALDTLADNAAGLLRTERESVTQRVRSLGTRLEANWRQVEQRMVAARDAVDTLDYETTRQRIEYLNTLVTGFDDLRPEYGRLVIASAYGQSPWSLFWAAVGLSSLIVASVAFFTFRVLKKRGAI